VSAANTNALVQFPDGSAHVVSLFEDPVIGQPLVGVGIDDGWICDRVELAPPGETEYRLVILVSGA
jgi:hypothetical protein